MNAPTNSSLSASWDGYVFETYDLCFCDEEAQGDQKKFLCQDHIDGEGSREKCTVH